MGSMLRMVIERTLVVGVGGCSRVWLMLMLMRERGVPLMRLFLSGLGAW